MSQLAIDVTRGLMELQTFDAKSDQEDRSKQYHIGIKEGGNVTKPGDFADVPDSEWGDPVNYRYPMADKAHADNAAARWADNHEQYSAEEQAIITKRIEAAQAAYGETKSVAEELNEEQVSEDLWDIFCAFCSAVYELQEEDESGNGPSVDAYNALVDEMAGLLKDRIATSLAKSIADLHLKMQSLKGPSMEEAQAELAPVNADELIDKNAEILDVLREISRKLEDFTPKTPEVAAVETVETKEIEDAELRLKSLTAQIAEAEKRAEITNPLTEAKSIPAAGYFDDTPDYFA